MAVCVCVCVNVCVRDVHIVDWMHSQISVTCLSFPLFLLFYDVCMADPMCYLSLICFLRL